MRSRQHDPAVRQSDDAVSEAASQIDLVQVNERGNAVFSTNSVKVCEHLLAGRRIKAGDRFIGKDNRRSLRHGPGDSDPLLLTARQLVGAIKGSIEQANPLKRLQGDETIRPRQRK